MKRLVSILTCVMISISVIGVAAGDSGVINPRSKISEPDQKAVIGWNGTHEKLILSTNFTHEADEKIQAVRVIPFPSLPYVKQSHEKIFEKVDEIVKDLTETTKIERFNTQGFQGTNGVKIEWKADIASHNLTAYRVNSPKEFSEIVREKFESILSKSWEMENPIEEVIDNYLERELQYFVIDMVDLGDSGGLAEPLLYGFQTESLYYPLLISSLSERVDRIDLAIFSKKLIDPAGFKDSHLNIECYTWLSKRQVRDVSKDISEMFDTGIFERDKIAFSYFSNEKYDEVRYRDIVTSSYKENPRRLNGLSVIALSVFLCSSSILAWFDLKYNSREKDES